MTREEAKQAMEMFESHGMMPGRETRHASATGHSVELGKWEGLIWRSDHVFVTLDAVKRFLYP